MSKKSIQTLLFSVIFLIISACGQGAAPEDNGKLMVYTSLYPLADFTNKIAGERVIVKNIVPPGVDAHDFEPKMKDMMLLEEADLLIYNGVGFEGWIEKAVATLQSEKLHIVSASEGVDLLHGELDQAMMDPHVWLDPNRAKMQAHTIKKELIALDPEYKEEYEENFTILSEQFDDLDARLRDLGDHTNKKTIVVSHDSFGYVTETYGFEQIAVSGLSPGHEPTQRQLQAIIESIKENEVDYVLFEPMISGKIAEVIQKEVGAEALVLHPLENLTEEEVAAGKDYFSLMNANIETLKKALDYQGS